jgi:hypothetical protein
MLVQGRNVLKRNGIFAVAVDFSVDGRHSAWVSFGHSQLLVNLSPILLAIRTHSPILYASVDRTDDRRNRITILPLEHSFESGNDHEKATAVASVSLSRTYARLKDNPADWWLWPDCKLRAQEMQC